MIKKKKILFLFIALILMQFLSFTIKAQRCTTLGQTPQTAFPICGSTASPFSQSSVGICGNTNVVSKCTSTNVNFTDKNPYWYRFKCYATGTLAFSIKPYNASDDYDWQLFDITNRNIADLYTDISMFVACNWSGEPGTTGASSSGTSLVECEGPGVPLFSAMPTVIKDHEYLLLVSHFTDGNQSGYSLTFQDATAPGNNSTAVITDTIPPRLYLAKAACDALTVSIKLNKKMKCNSIETDGSQFTIKSSSSKVIKANSTTCSNSFDTDSLTLTLSNPLLPGNYLITIQNGNTSDTTLKDNCDNAIPEGQTIPLLIYPKTPTPMDSLAKVGCSPQTLELYFRKSIRCNSIAPNGSDFVITGTYPVTVTSAKGVCTSGLSSKIIIQLSAPLQRAGNFQIKLVKGTDGNTIIDECGSESIAGQTINFTTADTVNADFTYSTILDCKKDVINFSHSGNNNVNQWQWTFTDQPTSTLQSPTISYTNFGIKDVKLTVNNGTCSDTVSKKINLNNYIKAGFEGITYICPNDQIIFKDTSVGNISHWEWDFGNGNTSSSPVPPVQFYTTTNHNNYNATIRLIVSNNIPCSDTAIQTAKVLWNCYIAVPSAFTPNKDGLNDYLYPLNAYKAKDLKFSVYNRFGERLFYSENWLNKWDGTFKSKPAEMGTYVWTLYYTDSDTNKKVERRGTTVLIR